MARERAKGIFIDLVVGLVVAAILWVGGQNPGIAIVGGIAACTGTALTLHWWDRGAVRIVSQAALFLIAVVMAAAGMLDAQGVQIAEPSWIRGYVIRLAGIPRWASFLLTAGAVLGIAVWVHAMARRFRSTRSTGTTDNVGTGVSDVAQAVVTSGRLSRGRALLRELETAGFDSIRHLKQQTYRWISGAHAELLGLGDSKTREAELFRQATSDYDVLSSVGHERYLSGHKATIVGQFREHLERFDRILIPELRLTITEVQPHVFEHRAAILEVRVTVENTTTVQKRSTTAPSKAIII